MGWRGNLRTVGRIIRSAERESIRRQNFLVKQQAQYQKMQELERAAYEVEEYENHIERMISIHKDCISGFDWKAIVNTPEPIKPNQKHANEIIAQRNIDNYKPSFFDKLFHFDKRKIEQFKFKLESAVQADKSAYQEELKQYEIAATEVKENIEIARNINEGNLDYYKKAVEELAPFSEISGLGSELGIQFPSRDKVIANIQIHDEKVIPKKMKSLLKSGKLSEKDVPVGRYFELYQDHVCSAVIRVARELFGLLPIEVVVVTAKGKLLNQANGKLEDCPVLSVLFIRDTMNGINFDLIDPSECLSNFKHNMNFKKTQGMLAVKEIE